MGPTSKIAGMRVLACIAAIFCVAAGVRLSFAAAVLSEAAGSRSGAAGYLTHDSPEYLDLAGAPVRDGLQRAIATGRTLGYPVFLSVYGSCPAPILLSQALLTTIIPVCAFVLTLLLTRTWWLAAGAGLTSALSPTGIGIGAMVMSDALFASLFAVYFLTLVVGAQRKSIAWLAVSSVLGALAMLVRPIFLFDPALSLCVLALVAATPSRGFALRGGIVLVVGPLVAFLAVATATYEVTGVFTFSATGERTLSEYLGAKSEAWADAGRPPSMSEIRAEQARVRERMDHVPPAERPQAYDREGVSAAAARPWVMAEAFADDIRENLTSSWSYFGRQLPGAGSRWAARLERIDGLMRVLLLGLVIAASAVAAALRARPLFAMIVPVVAFALASGLTFWTGSRILYPVEVVEIVVAAVALRLAFSAVRLPRPQPAFQLDDELS